MTRMILTLVTVALVAFPHGVAADDGERTGDTVALDAVTLAGCLNVLREGMNGEDFWPAIHAAEGLTAAGYGKEVRETLLPRLDAETDDQRRCGLARELVRAGDRRHANVMLEILAGEDEYGHVHAAESLYKVWEIGDGTALRGAFAQTENVPLRLMSAAALARSGNPEALKFLREALGHDDPEVGRIAAWVLARVGDETDIPALSDGAAEAEDDLVRAFYQHALAALGDEAGREALVANLSDEDPAVRTYAAEFAVDARATSAGAQLKTMLNDEHPDARYRAAHALIALSQPATPDPLTDFSALVYEATEENPRYTEGSVVDLNDGSLLYATTEFSGSGSDFARAHIVARRSQDGGRTWSEPRILQENTGDLNVMSATLRRLRAPAEPGEIGFFYLQKDGFNDLNLYVRFSDDEAETFGEPVLVTADPGYHVVNNDRVTQLSSGRLVVPAASTEDVRSVNHFVSHCYLSDDGGRTWRNGKGAVDMPRRGAMEPEVIELTDGRLMMILRNQLGYVAAAYSEDEGDTWSEAESLGVTAPEAPATIRRIPATGDLLLVWNNTYTEGAGHGGRRTPLTAAVSSDEGESWTHVKNLESDPDHTYSYTSILFFRGRALLTYWISGPGEGRYSSQFRSVPVSWFYAEE
ncbi:MAG: sialidase [Planctomycetota bacterium]|nr:MAG: sialidase [Planctomycetota bacterium]REJ88430.1 MAG: sialidase [Planctomycetota bacterium]REK24859.1 MAG: sialidase [Planctomycetota bacterium]REK40132.1 MAG: sialidase [Planctomycetota bacterium]